MKRNRFGRIVPDSTPDDQVYWDDKVGFTGNAKLGLPEPVRRPPHTMGTGKRRPTMFKHFIVNDKLPPEHRDEYHALVLKPGTTIPQLNDWLVAHGVNVNKKSIAKHRKFYFAQHHGLYHTADLAKDFNADYREQCKSGEFSEAAAGRTEQLLLDRLLSMKPEQTHTFTPNEWQQITRAVRNLLEIRKQAESIRDDLEKKEAKRKEADPNEVGPDGYTAPQRVAVRVRQMLGFPIDKLPQAKGQKPAELPAPAPLETEGPATAE